MNPKVLYYLQSFLEMLPSSKYGEYQNQSMDDMRLMKLAYTSYIHNERLDVFSFKSHLSEIAPNICEELLDETSSSIHKEYVKFYECVAEVDHIGKLIK